MKQAALVFIFLGFFGFISARVNTDSLAVIAESPSTPDTTRIKLYGDISWELLASDLIKSQQYAEKELELAKKTGRKADEAQAESDLGNIYNRKSEYDAALEHYYRAAGIRKKLDQEEKLAGVYVNIATVLTRQSKHREALDIYFKSLKIFEKKKDLRKQSVVLGNVGHIYYELEQNKEAYLFFKRSLDLALEIKDQPLTAGAYSFLGGLKQEERDLDSTLYYYRMAEKVNEENNLVYNLATIYNNTGRVYTLKKDYPNAIAYYTKSLELRTQLEDKFGIGTCNLNLGELYKITGDYEKSLEHLKKSLEIATELHSFTNIKQSYGFTAEVYQAKGELKTAIHYFQLYSEYKDSVYNEDVAEKFTEMKTRYETEKKDLEIAKHKAELEAREQQDFIKNIIIVSILVLVLLAGLLTWSVVKRRQLKQKAEAEAEMANQKVLRSKAVIEAEEKERVRIAQDLHDGVGQLLSAAKLNLSGLEASLRFNQVQDEVLFKNAIDLVNDSVKEVRAVSHNMMPNTLIKLGLASAIREFISRLGSLPNLKVDLEIVGLDERLDQQVESVLYRVIQETVNNIIKHARANHISMQLIRHEHELTVMIADNGIGFDTSRINDAEGLGLKGMTSRIEFLNGRIEFDSSPGKGTTVTIEVAC